MTKKVRVVFERSEGRWLADAPDLPRCSVSGRSIQEARRRLREAVAAYLKEGEEYELVEEISW